MRLGDLIQESTLALHLNQTDKVGIIEGLTRFVSESHDLDARMVLREVMEREHSLSTGVGQGVAVPHALLRPLDTPVIGLARLDKGVDFDSLDEEPVRLVFLLLSPGNDIPLHLKLLSRISRLCQRPQFREGLLQATDAAGVIALLRAAEADLPDL